MITNIHPVVSSIPELAKYGITDISVAAGTFDGVHLGHQKLLDTLLKQAEQTKTVPVVLTFTPHPREVLFPEKQLSLLVSPAERIRLLFEKGVKAVINMKFDTELANLSPEDFLNSTLFDHTVHIRGFCVGSEWHFGAKGAGNTAYLEKAAEHCGFRFESVPELVMDQEIVSSTAIRKAVCEGNMEKAARFLGRSYCLHGIIEHGVGIAGTKLECPTANLAISEGTVPANGVYAGTAYHEGQRYPAAIAVGTAPTFQNHGNGRQVRIEVHLLDYSGDLYGKKMTLAFHSHLREERTFENPESLKIQIGEDIRHIREYFR